MAEAAQKKKETLLYMKVYEFYRTQMREGRLPPGSRMPSLRRCAMEMGLSRTTVENAYLQLAADGYIAAKPQSGYYVTARAKNNAVREHAAQTIRPKARYSFMSGGVDPESFRFDLWRRYIKSVLREDERLLSYGEPQGERELREALVQHVREQRNILCAPEDIVIGAGTQSLLQLLCPLLVKRRTVSFPADSFVHGAAVFADFGFEVHYRDKICDVIYVSPAHMTSWGEIMPVKRRLELVALAQKENRLIIEDDFENEFVYLQKPTPSLFGLDGGEHVVYFGSFSRLLLPSIRISFMILPPALKEAYLQKQALYNQTASKTEQLALCRFIRDGHLSAQTRRLRRLYAQKLKSLRQAVEDVFGRKYPIMQGAAGTALALTLPWNAGGAALRERLLQNEVALDILRETDRTVTLVLSCSAMPETEFEAGCRAIAAAADIVS